MEHMDWYRNQIENYPLEFQQIYSNQPLNLLFTRVKDQLLPAFNQFLEDNFTYLENFKEESYSFNSSAYTIYKHKENHQLYILHEASGCVYSYSNFITIEEINNKIELLEKLFQEHKQGKNNYYKQFEYPLKTLNEVKIAILKL